MFYTMKHCVVLSGNCL